jgi:hypothetical protein
LILWTFPNWSAHRPVTLALRRGGQTGSPRGYMRSTIHNEGTGDGDMDAVETDVAHASAVTEHCRESRLDGASRFAEERSSPD